MTAREWPAPPLWFEDRKPKLAEMERLVVEAGAAGRPALIALYGLPGVGKTALAARFCKRLARLFPDGVYYVKVGDPERGAPESVDSALNRLLDDLGCGPERRALFDTEGKTAELRSLLFRRRVALILDDVGLWPQVEMFLPNSPGSALIVTSRSQLSGLSARGFRWLEVGPLVDPYDRRLFAAALGAARRLEPADVDAILRLCGGLPLLIWAVTGQLDAAPAALLSKAVRRFGREGLDAVEKDLLDGVTGPLDLVYGALPPELARVYRCLALHPGAEFEVASVAALLGVDQDQAETYLDRLVYLHLLTLRGERYGFHDTIRWHAGKWVPEDESKAERRQAFERIARWYLAETVRYDRVLSGRWRVGSLYQQPAVGPVPTRRQALDWLEFGLDSLLATIELAVQEEHHLLDLAAQLCEAIWGVCHLHGHHDALISSHLRVLPLVQAAGDDLFTMRIASQLASAYLKQRDRDAARKYFQLSLDAAVRIGHALGEQSALEWLGKVADGDGDIGGALGYYQRSQEAAWRVEDPVQRERMLALLGLQLGRLHNKLGRSHNKPEEFVRAQEVLAPALEYFAARRPEPDNRAKTLLELGRALVGQEKAGEALAPLETAVAVFAADGSHKGRGDALVVLAKAAKLLGDRAAALDRLREALDCYTLIGDTVAMDQVSRLLAELE